MNVSELIDDLKSALDQMNRSLSKIVEQNDENNKLLADIVQKLDNS
jgi:hypothetical protein